MPRGNLTVLNVAEKHDAAKRISAIMSNGNSSRREGYSKFNKIFDFDYNILNSNCKMVMTSVSGHLLNLEFCQGYRKWNQCRPIALFEAPVRQMCPEDYQNIKRTLQREVRKCQVLIIWTDGDREGENIGFEIIEVCKEVKPNIRLYRAKFSEITPHAINTATQNLVSPDENVNNAVEIRKELDLRIGASFTRFQTLRLQKLFPNFLANQVISYGSCQFPTLGFVVERYKQVQEFIPETFYKIRVIHRKDDILAEFSWQRGRLFMQRVCAIICAMCQENPNAKVLKVVSKPKSKWRPLPLDTIELEKTASRKLKISAKDTMGIAEKLYNKGIISYPRTETNIFPKGMNLAGLVENQIPNPQWGAFAAGILQNGGPNPRQGKKTDNAHPPIHPLKLIDSLEGKEKKVYEFIVRHFLACLSEDAKGRETTIEIEIACEHFSTHGLVIIARNYLEVYIYESWNAKNIPNYDEGEIFIPNSIDMINGETQAPPLLSEADLIALMDKHGIGTDATHADHIEKIKGRQYVGVQQDGTFLPGKLGMGLVEGYDAMGFAMSKPHLRASLEADLKKICDGIKDKDVVLAEQIRNYREVFEQTAIHVEKLDQALSQYFGAIQDVTEEEIEPVSEPIRKCPKCGNSDMALRQTKEEKAWFLGCMGYPDCRNSIFFPKCVVNVKKSHLKCLQCKPQPVNKLVFDFKRGSVPPMMISPYTSCIGCDDLLLGLLGSSRNNTTKQTPRQPGNTDGSNRSGQQNPRNTLTGPPNQRGKQKPPANQKKRKKDGGNDTLQNNTLHGRRGNNLNLQHNSNATQSIHVNQGRSNFTNSNNQGNTNNDDNVVVCDCAIPAMSLTVKKPGPNLGRPFYKCGSSNNVCTFFLWGDSSDAQTFNNNNSSNRQHTDQHSHRHNDSSHSNNVNCTCSLPAVIRTVNKDGPNKGRQFYCCAKPMSQGCGFFKWADENEGAVASTSMFGNNSCNRPDINTSINRFKGQPSHLQNTSDSTDINCNCDTPAVMRTVNKDGPNKGRQFYCCTKPMNQGCGFFKWVDENQDGTGNRKRKRKCGMCGEEGHTKKTCPLSK